MGSRPFSNADPFLQLVVLFLTGFLFAGLFLLMAQGLVLALWGMDVFGNESALQDFTNPQVIHINRVLLFFQHLGLFVVPAIVFSKLISFDWKERLGFRMLSLQYGLLSALAIVACLPLISALAWMNELMALPDFLSSLEAALTAMEEGANRLTEAITKVKDVPSLLLNIFVVALVPAIGEEMIFRGLVLPILHKWTGKTHAAVWISAALFSAIHLQFYGFLPRLVLGALLGYLFVYSRSLWAPIIAHFVNNGLALVLLFFMARGSLSEDIDSFEPDAASFVWAGVSVLISTGVLAYMWRDTNKRQISDDEAGIGTDGV